MIRGLRRFWRRELWLSLFLDLEPCGRLHALMLVRGLEGHVAYIVCRD
jgi:hypothetical protein